MTSVGDWLVANREKLEKGMEVMGGACEVLASTVGQLNPILEAVFQGAAELLKNPEGKEAQYLAKQFEKVNENLNKIQKQGKEILLKEERSALNIMYFQHEVQIIAQFEKFVEFVNTKPKFKEAHKKYFVKLYEKNRDYHLVCLYNAVMGESSEEHAMLDTILKTEKRNRRTVEVFCACLKRLFVMGIFAVLGYSALMDGKVEEDIVKEWQDKMEKVEMRMKDAVDECVNNFAEQAKMDVEELIQLESPEVSKAYSTNLLKSLTEKYDWVRWSIRIFKHREKIFFYNWMAGSKYQGNKGGNHFAIFINNKIHFVVSFCVDPPPINKSEIQEKIQQQNLKRNMMAVALSLHSCFPNYLVHAVSHYKEVVETNNFSEDTYYFDKYKKAHLCIHPQ